MAHAHGHINTSIYPHQMSLTIRSTTQAVSQQARDIQPMLFKCLATVCVAGPTLKQHRVNVLCLLTACFQGNSAAHGNLSEMEGSGGIFKENQRSQ